MALPLDKPLASWKGLPSRVSTCCSVVFPSSRSASAGRTNLVPAHPLSTTSASKATHFVVHFIYLLLFNVVVESYLVCALHSRLEKIRLPSQPSGNVLLGQSQM